MQVQSASRICKYKVQVKRTKYKWKVQVKNVQVKVQITNTSTLYSVLILVLLQVKVYYVVGLPVGIGWGTECSSKNWKIEKFLWHRNCFNLSISWRAFGSSDILKFSCTSKVLEFLPIA